MNLSQRGVRIHRVSGSGLYLGMCVRNAPNICPVGQHLAAEREELAA